MVSLVVDSGALSEDDYIEKTIGNLKLHYYLYLDTFHVRPRDLIDMVDGILYNKCKGYIQQKQIAEIKHRQEQGK